MIALHQCQHLTLYKGYTQYFEIFIYIYIGYGIYMDLHVVTYIVYILSRTKIKGIILQKIFYSIPSVDFMRDGFAQSTKVLFRSSLC